MNGAAYNLCSYLQNVESPDLKFVQMINLNNWVINEESIYLNYYLWRVTETLNEHFNHILGSIPKNWQFCIF